MKTAMQELLENLQKQFNEETHPIRIDGTYFLEKEKEQFHDMFEEGFESAYQHFVNGKDFVKFEEYYNQTYNQNK